MSINNLAFSHGGVYLNQSEGISNKEIVGSYNHRNSRSKSFNMLFIFNTPNLRK